jgi:hypothetical protein|tara:strand:+ start:716 stop:1423 length:708 start_codon:yes stop_codon:yes gene_type:complete
MKGVQKIVNDISKALIDKLGTSGLVSLYLSGTILTKDRVHNSDIDFFGFVKKSFDIEKEEDEINGFLDRNRKKLCGGFECRFRAIGLDEINGKKRGRISRFFGMGSISLTFPFWKLVFGRDVKFDKRVKPYSLRFRKRKAIGKLNFMIGKVRGGEDYFLRHLSKEIIRLAGIESEMVQNKKYEYSYVDIEKRFFKDKNHIVHEAMRFRRKKFKKKDMLNFIPEIEAYVKNVRGLR